jgi:hypothetical protein
MITKTLQPIKEPNWKFYDYAFDLEKEWKASLSRFTDKELLEIFPESKKIIPKKIKEWGQKRAKFSDIIKKKLTLIKYKITDEFSQWFWREWVKVSDGEELLKIDNHIARLKRLLMVAKGWKPKGRLTEEQIQQALAVPIENLINQPLRKSGKALVGLCPLHNEKRPSFYIYSKTNSCWCYGCNQGGDVINFVRLLHGYSFKEAVKYLIGKK